jgi:hypothetical protein
MPRNKEEDCFKYICQKCAALREAEFKKQILSDARRSRGKMPSRCKGN